MEGWLLLHRKMQDNGLWQDKPFAKGQAWIDLLMSASHKDHSFWVRDIEVKVKAGQVAMSEVTMSKRWGWSRNKVRRFLLYLENNGKTIQQKSNVTTLITILNWKSYQETKQQTKQQKDSNETPNDTQSKNVKNEEEIKTIVLMLNSASGKDFKHTTDETKKSIRGRLSEGYSLQDFQRVIESKVKEWQGTDSEKYIRPSTLFSPSKFEAYLNASPKVNNQEMNWVK